MSVQIKSYWEFSQNPEFLVLYALSVVSDIIYPPIYKVSLKGWQRGAKKGHVAIPSVANTHKLMYHMKG